MSGLCCEVLWVGRGESLAWGVLCHVPVGRGRAYPKGTKARVRSRWISMGMVAQEEPRST